MVDTHDIHGSIGRRSRDDDLLGTSLQVSRGLFNGGEDSSRLANYIGFYRSPSNILRVAFGKELDLASVDDEAVSINGNFSSKSSVDRIMLELVSSVFNREEGIVDGDDGGASALNGSAGDQANESSRVQCETHKTMNIHR